MVVRLLSHVRGNLVAYLALFVALGGTAIAAENRNSVGATALKPLVVRQSASVPVTNGSSAPAFKSCRSNEQFISGAAGWFGFTDPEDTQVANTQFIGAPGSNPTGFLANGFNNSGSTKDFFVQVACLKK